MTSGGVDPGDIELAATVVVPARPGPLVRLADVDRPRGEIDEVLDDVFGAPDEGGPGPLDAVLLFGGAGAVIAGLTSLAPMAVLVAGVISFGLGAVLPLRSLWRRSADGRRTARLHEVIGDGVLLRVDDPAVTALTAAYDRCVQAAVGVAPDRRIEADGIAHAAIVEVATLLAGRRPTGAADVDYVTARTVALADLANALTAVAGDVGPDPVERQALLEARAEVDQLDGGSAADEVVHLTRRLRGEA